MNYAQDALFWYLYHHEVRSLATLLTAPTPIIYPNEISVKELLGENGFRFLKQLDENPQLLLNHLQTTQDIKNYVEQLWHFWLNHSPNGKQLQQKEIHFSFDYYTQNNFSGSLKNNTVTRGLVCVADENKKHFSHKAWHCSIIHSLPEISPNERWVHLTLAEYIAPALRCSVAPFLPPSKNAYIATVIQNADGLWREKERFLFQAA
ncbi:MAG: hypothetical protein IIU35_02045 [Neisseriaceae bacterium]|nr:hypothetical protein [Neisseriaceae bacterium]